MPNVKYKLLYVLTFLFVFLLNSFPAFAYTESYFEDDFSLGSTKWNVVRNYQYLNHALPCMNGGVPSTWNILSGEYGIKIQGSYCVTETIPKDEYWDNAWNDYIYELDMHFVSGVDKNIAWRYTDENNWLGVHVIAPWAYFQRIVQDFHNNYQQLYDGHTYHFKIIANGQNHDVYYYDINTPENVSHMKGHRDDTLYLTGRPALQASAGGSPNDFSETYFDNIKVTSLEIPDPTPTPTPTPSPTPPPFPPPEPTPFIDLPYFSQTDPAWGGMQYDSTDQTISQWGCALTSIAMVLKYHGIDMVPDGGGGMEPLTPLSLNRMLVNLKGYAGFGQLSFPKITRLSKLLIDRLKEEGRSFDFKKLEYRKIAPVDFSLVDSILTDRLQPLIFHENLAFPSLDHFLVATRTITSGSEYAISDPIEESRTNFIMPPSSLTGVRYFEPANSNASYLWFLTDPNLALRVLTPEGEVTDDHSATPSAMLDFLPGLANDLDASHSADNSGWEFDYKYPPSGEYLIKYRPETDGWHNIWWYLSDVEGEDVDVDGKYFGGKQFENTIKLVFPIDDIEHYSIEKVVDFPTLLSDLKALKRLGWIKQKGLYTSLNSIFNVCRPFHHYRWKGFEKMWQSAIRKVEKLPDRFITPEAREIILYDLNYLLGHYNPPPHRPWPHWR